MERLVDGAQGMFRWVTCQLDYLCELSNDAAKRKALKSLPPDLKGTYERILRRVNDSAIDNQILVARSLRWMTFAKKPLPSEALCEAVSINEGALERDEDTITNENEILRWCSSLIRKNTSTQRLELAHFTVEEFLRAIPSSLSGEFASYRIDGKEDEMYLAKTCLRYLNFRDFAVARGPETYSPVYPFQSYAAFFWDHHARPILHDPAILALAGRLFDQKSSAFFLWAQTYLQSWHENYFHEPAEVDYFKDLLATATPLHFAAALSLPELCRRLLQCGCSSNQISAIGTPLCCCVRGCCFPWFCSDLHPEFFDEALCDIEYSKAVLDILRDAKADPNYTPPWLGLSPLYISILRRDEVVLSLLKYKPRLDEESLTLLEGNFVHDKEIGLLKKIIHVAAACASDIVLPEHLPRFHRLVSKYLPSGLTRTVEADYSLGNLEHCNALLLSAAQDGQLELCRQLVMCNNVDINAADKYYRASGLHLAAKNDHVRIAEMLLNCGADHRLMDQSGRTALHYSVSMYGTRCLSLLLHKGFDAFLADTHGFTLWHIAVLQGNVPALDVLKNEHSENLASPLTKCKNGRSPLQCAVRKDNVEVVKILLHLTGSLSGRGSDGSTLLHYAVKHSCERMIIFLIEQSFDCQAQDANGLSPLHSAMDMSINDGCTPDIRRQIRNAQVLMDSGADPSLPSNDGSLPIHALCSSAYSKCPTYGTNILTKLIQRSGNLSAKDAQGYSALHRLCQNRDVDNSDVLAILLESGASMWLEDRAGVTCFQTLINTVLATEHDSERREKKAALCLVTLDHLSDTERYRNMQVMIILLGFSLKYNYATLTEKLLDLAVDVDKRIREFNQASALEIASAHSLHIDLYERLLQKSTSMLECNPVSGQAPLHLACERRDGKGGEIVGKLLESGVDPDLRSRDNITGLIHAAWAGNAYTVYLLLSAGANVNHHGSIAAFHATRLGHVGVLNTFLGTALHWDQKFAMCEGQYQLEDLTLLQVAAISGRVEVVNFLFENSLIVDVNARSNQGHTALYIACYKGHEGIVSFLLEHDADHSLSGWRDNISPLLIAASFGFMQVVTLLIQFGSDVEAVDSSDFTAELRARRAGHKQVADVLHEAAINQGRRGHASYPDRLSDALKFAIGAGDLKFCQQLVEDGVYLGHGIRTCSQYTPVLHSLQLRQLEIAKYLISKGASIHGNTYEHTDERGFNAFHYAAFFDDAQLLALLLKQHPVNCMLSHLHPMEQVVNDLGTPLQVAVREGKGSIAAMLIESGAPLSNNHSSEMPEHLLCLAAFHENPSLAQLLIEQGANVNARNADLKTPCMIAASQNNPMTLQKFIAHGGDLQLRSRHGWQAMHYAAYSQALPIMTSLSTEYGCGLGDLTTYGVPAWMICEDRRFDISYILNSSVHDLTVVTVRDGGIFHCLIDYFRHSSNIIKMIARRLPKDSIYGLINHHSPLIDSPLYMATLAGNFDVMPALLDAGAEIDLEGGEEGTPLMAACTAGRLSAVKLLLQRGASMCYTKEGRRVSALHAARYDARMTKYLLVGRFTDHAKLLTAKGLVSEESTLFKQ